MCGRPWTASLTQVPASIAVWAVRSIVSASKRVNPCDQKLRLFLADVSLKRYTLKRVCVGNSGEILYKAARQFLRSFPPA